jgi:hypothetical protein
MIAVVAKPLVADIDALTGFADFDRTVEGVAMAG